MGCSLPRSASGRYIHWTNRTLCCVLIPSVLAIFGNLENFGDCYAHLRDNIYLILEKWILGWCWSQTNNNRYRKVPDHTMRPISLRTAQSSRSPNGLGPTTDGILNLKPHSAKCLEIFPKLRQRFLHHQTNTKVWIHINPWIWTKIEFVSSDALFDSVIIKDCCVKVFLSQILFISVIRKYDFVVTPFVMITLILPLCAADQTSVYLTPYILIQNAEYIKAQTVNKSNVNRVLPSSLLSNHLTLVNYICIAMCKTVWHSQLDSPNVTSFYLVVVLWINILLHSIPWTVPGVSTNMLHVKQYFKRPESWFEITKLLLIQGSLSNSTGLWT